MEPIEALAGFTLLLSVFSAITAAISMRRHSKSFLRRELTELADRMEALESSVERKWKLARTERATENVQRGRQKKLAEDDDAREIDDAQRRGPLAMLKYNMRKNGLD